MAAKRQEKGRENKINKERERESRVGERQEKVLKFVSEFMKISFWEFISEAGGRHRASKRSGQGEAERGAKEKRTTREERQETGDEMS